MKVAALLTGRGNNTLPDKNVLEILGKPVLFYPANAAKKCKEIDSWYCSSDDQKILDAAAKQGYKSIKRPPEFALPTSQHIDCILHALKHINDDDVLPDICVVLLANNVTIKSSWITDCVNKMIADPSLTAVVPVYMDNDHHPYRAKSLNQDGTLSPFIKDLGCSISTNRQDLPPCYYVAHNFWVLNVPFVLSEEKGQIPWTFMGNRILPYNIDSSIDIHESEDLIIAKHWIASHYID